MDCSTLRSPTLLIFRADLEVESSPMRVHTEQVILICQPLFAGKSADFIPKYPLSRPSILFLLKTGQKYATILATDPVKQGRRFCY